MATATADWCGCSGWAGERSVTGPAEALALCDEIEAHADSSPLIVGFTSEHGHFFGIGLGADESCAMYWESADPPYFQSRGDATADNLIDFAYGGQQTELPGTVRIPRSDALRALAEFMETDALPECIAWDET